MKPRRRARPLALLLVAVLLVGAAACSDDGGDDATDETTTTEATTGDDRSADDPDATADDTSDDADATTEGDDPDAGDDGTTTSDDPDVTTTSPNLTPNDSPLGDLLLAPSEVGAGYAPDDTLGDGSFDGDLCEEVTVEAAFDDQAAQGLLQGTGEAAVSFTQAVMRFPDAAAAEGFVTAVVEGIEQCSPGAEITEVDAGDQAVIATDETEGFAIAAGVVRVGDLVSWTASLTATLAATPITDDLVGTAGEHLSA